MNTLSKLTLISVMISAMAGCSVRKDGNNLSNVTTADSLLFTEPLDTLPDGVISSVSWLPLQNSDQRIIDEISKLSVVDSFIVIGSRRQAVLQVYSTEGKFLYEISEKGQGPEEYLEIATFTVTPTSIYILDNFSHKISRYALEKGTFMGKTEVPFVAWDMEAFDDNDFLFTCLNNNPDVKVSPSPVDFAVWRTDSHWQITDKYLPVEKNIRNFMASHGILPGTNTTLFSIPFNMMASLHSPGKKIPFSSHPVLPSVSPRQRVSSERSQFRPMAVAG